MKNKKIVAFVPIKLNSQRLKNKNILPFKGKNLCWHIFSTLLEVERIDEVYVFCSDIKIKNYIPKDVKFLKREEELDGNLVKGVKIYDSFVKKINADIYILAHTTSPFISEKTINNSLDKILLDDYDSAFSVQKFQTFSWYKGKPKLQKN